jgi:hypothetical protein
MSLSGDSQRLSLGGTDTAQEQDAPKISAINHLSFEEAFERLLPIELKQMIFKFAASDRDDTSDLYVKLAADQVVPSTLQSAAITFLEHLKNHKSMAVMHKQALQYLTARRSAGSSLAIRNHTGSSWWPFAVKFL